ncbi:hypothetical protein OIO90_001105 [Microbotryomycetes sp. JL221]|nr:hypothetical protein OIO90_001105 [Microbotryomycetes sp. JL221]
MADAPQSIVYKTVNGLDIAFDVYHVDSATRDKPAPILLWFHGGGLLQGTRKACWPHLKSAPKKHGLCMISADYRHAPQARMPDILSDVADCVSFIRSAAFTEKTQGKADATKLIVSGGSAGGWLALLASTGVGFEACGLEAPEKPLCICPIYPISDLLDPFWTNKQDKASYFPRRIEANELEQYLNPNSTVTASCETTSPRTLFYHYMIQEGILADLLLKDTGLDPSLFSIAPAIASGKHSAPPTYIVHGTIDDKVPIQQSIDVVEALKKQNIDHDFEVLEGQDHLFDTSPEVTMDRMYDFIKNHI